MQFFEADGPNKGSHFEEIQQYYNITMKEICEKLACLDEEMKRRFKFIQ